MFNSSERGGPSIDAAGEPLAADTVCDDAPPPAESRPGPSSQERTSARDDDGPRRRSTHQGGKTARKDAGRCTEPRPGSSPAEDFRNIASSIEGLRNERERSPQNHAEPAGEELCLRPADPSDHSLHSKAPREAAGPALTAHVSTGELADALAEAVARVADKSDVMRLERLLEDLIDRVSALESGRTVRAGERPESDGARQAGAKADRAETSAGMPRRRLTRVPRPAPIAEPQPARARTRPPNVTPRRLWP